MSYKFDNHIRTYIMELSKDKKLGWFPQYMYDCLEENVPHGLVVKLGEIIIKNKGVGFSD